MPRLALLLSLPVIALAGIVSPAAAKVRTGPSGTAFYKPPHKLPGKTHGDPIWVRSLRGKAALKPASMNQLILYRSVDASGKAVAVSGTITLPKGKPPKSGWPVLTWAHGTTGIADICAPSRDGGSLLSSYVYPELAKWLKAHYAVVRTDYQGLGTPGTHGYLVGLDEGRSVLDIVRAARKADPSIGKRVIIGGHSQGGHAALWAAALAPKWTPDLDVRGTEAFAPASHIEDQAKVIATLTTPSGISGLAALILRGVDTANPSLHLSTSVLSAQGAALYPETLSECLPALDQANSFGGLAPAQIFNTNADLGPTETALGKSDPEHLRIKTPLFIAQGSADTTVFPAFTNQLEQQLTANGAKIAPKTYDGVTHANIVSAADKDGLAFARKELRKR
ncbi:MAG TPA: alpha/beta fold hydrolase [Thermoleophilaceae bacterium]|jgi:pimeloyl-ACP methyl ester carboxylesterase